MNTRTYQFMAAIGSKSYLFFCAVIVISLASGCASQAPKSSTHTPAPVEVTKSSKSVVKNKPTQKNTAKVTTGDLVVANAQSVLGTPYRYGGNHPSSGFDCSGLVYYSYNQLGLSVPRTTKQQAVHASPLSLQEIEPGDILFFRIYGNGVSHVGIYTGDDQFIHAPKSGKQVSYADINQPYWRERLIKVGRLH